MSDVIQWILVNYQLVLSSVMAVLTAIVAVAMVIPGDQPEKFLQGVVDFLAKFSKK